MKKRRFLAIVLSIFWLCLTGMNAFTVRASEASEEYEIDDVMRNFMKEHDLPEIVTPTDCGLALIYRQIDGKNAGFSFTGPNDIMKDSYGISANMVAYKSGETNFHLYLDIRFEGDADIFEHDILSIEFPEKSFYVPDGILPTQSLSINDSGEWHVENSGAALMSDGDGFIFNLNEHAPQKETSRILLYISGITSTDSGSALQNVTVTWVHRVTEAEPLSEAVLSPSTITLPVEDDGAFPWKAILIVLLFDLDLVAIFLIARHVRKKRRTQNGTQPKRMSADGDVDAEAELQQNLKLKSEDIEYLKEIGYFDPNKK